MSRNADIEIVLMRNRGSEAYEDTNTSLFVVDVGISQSRGP